MMTAMNKRKIQTYEIILCIFLLILIIVGLIMPKTGRFVLIDEICNTAVIWIVCIFVIARTAGRRADNCAWGKVVRGIVITLLLAVGIWFTKDVALDFAKGPEVTVLSNLQVSQTRAHTGIFSLHYYLTGTDSSGERVRLEVAGDDCSEISGRDTIRVEYYANTGRIVRFM